MGDKSAAKSWRRSTPAAATTLPRLLFALGIRDVGEATALSLARHFGDVDGCSIAEAEAINRSKMSGR